MLATIVRAIQRRVWRHPGTGYVGAMSPAAGGRGRHLEPVCLAALMRQCPGKWVALRNGEIIEVRETFDQVVLALHERDITDATILRSPGEHESELVGLG